MINFGMESIAYQAKDSFTGELIQLCTEVKNWLKGNKSNKPDNLVEAGFSGRLTDLIRTRFGLNVIYDPLLTGINPAAIVPFVKDLMSLGGAAGSQGLMSGYSFGPQNKMWEKYMDRFDEIQKGVRQDAIKINGKRGSINLELAVVSGYMSEVRHHLLLDFRILYNQVGLDPEEVAAIIVHEIGHAFNGLQMHHRFTSTNTAIQNSLNAMNKNRPKEAYYIFKSTFTNKEVRESAISESSTIEDYYGAYADIYTKAMVDGQFSDRRYDNTSFEYSSDMFAAKFGLGGPLSSALNKLMRNFNEMSLLANRYLNIRNLFFMYMALFTLMYTGSVILFIIFGAIASIFGIIEAMIVPEYDTLIDRHERIRREINGILKDQSLPKSEVKVLLDQWNLIDDIIKETAKPVHFDSALLSIIIPSIRKSKYYKVTQQQIEKLLNNDMFAHAAKLNQLGD